MVKVAGTIFVRVWANKNPETAKHAEANEFMEGLLNGSFKTENKEFLAPYLKKFYELAGAMNLLVKNNS